MGDQGRKYSDHFIDMLVALGYTHCFFVPGGNTMHLLDSARTRMTCVPFVHEVSAAIATEYFCQVSVPEGRGRAFALVTAGPGLTNAITGLAGAFLESHECLVVGGQVKSSDLARGALRQRGIQEIDGIALAKPICKATARIEEPIPDLAVVEVVSQGVMDRCGPVFIEFCLDAQGMPYPAVTPDLEAFEVGPSELMRLAAPAAAEAILHEIDRASRPILLLGGGVDVGVAWRVADDLEALGVPLMTTWNGADRVSSSHPLFAGRPNTWGQRSANILLAQADLVVALGTRLGLQQTGFNWEDWCSGRVVQVDVDRDELDKGHPQVDIALQADAGRVLEILAESPGDANAEWLAFCREVRERVPLNDPANSARTGFVSPFGLMDWLSGELTDEDILIPASSGSGQFVPMQAFRVIQGQRVLTNKGLASMGYGLGGAVGAALAARDRRVVLVEGDGSFSQNLQELGTLAVQRLNVKMFLLDNDGYASIRTTQRNYFGGQYLGCDSSTGLGFPSWSGLAAAYGIPCAEITGGSLDGEPVASLMAADGPALIVVKVDPEQTFYPKVTSYIAADGSMRSNPISLMTPTLPDSTARKVFKYAPGEQAHG